MYNFKFEDLIYLAVELPQEVNLFKFSGDFDGELACIDRWLKRDLPVGVRKRLEIERVFANGLKHDYNTSAEQMLEGIKADFPSADMDTLNNIIASGNVDFILKNGVRYFQKDALRNIMITHTEYLKTVEDPTYQSKEEPIPVVVRAWNTMKEKGSCAYRYTVEEHFGIRPGFDREGKKIRVYLPYPVECETQSDIKLLDSSHPVYISSGQIRSAVIETEHHTGNDYFVRFSFVNRAKYHEISAEKVSEIQPDMPEYTCEQYPHIRFTPTIRALAREIAGDETNPLLLARRVYDWINDNIKYSLVRDYLYIDNLPEYLILNRYGDCGLMGIAFITLCRCLGIPAKWQSGSSIRPDHIGSHDWTMFYIAPFGWLYCDPSHGNTSCREKHEHYFGNLDPFRLVACNDFQLELDPPKKFFRMDPYDNQSGEAEYEDENITSEYKYTHREVLSAEEIE